MVYKVIIKDNTKSPIRYLNSLDMFPNGREFTFKDGINIIVGRNGSGKTTLMKLIESYLMVGEDGCDKGIYNSNINRMYGIKDSFLGGVDVYADYDKNTFRFCHLGERSNDGGMKDFQHFGIFFEQKNSSTGEAVNIALGQLFNSMFSEKAQLKFDYNQFSELYPEYVEYVNAHRQEGNDSWTILMDEPDRNLDIDNVGSIMDILSYQKEQSQVIAVVHNPLIIYKLSTLDYINFIEMTDGYVELIKKKVDELVK